MVPRPEHRRLAGRLLGRPAAAAGTTIPIEQFHLAHAGKDTAATINAALAAGKNLLLTPGIYHLEDAIRVVRGRTRSSWASATRP